MVVVVIVRMRVRQPIVRVFVGMHCAGRRWHHVGVVMVSIIVGVFVRVAVGIVGVSVRMLGHEDLLGWSARSWKSWSPIPEVDWHNRARRGRLTIV